MEKEFKIITIDFLYSNKEMVKKGTRKVKVTLSCGNSEKYEVHQMDLYNFLLKKGERIG